MRSWQYDQLCAGGPRVVCERPAIRGSSPIWRWYFLRGSGGGEHTKPREGGIGFLSILPFRSDETGEPGPKCERAIVLLVEEAALILIAC